MIFIHGGRFYSSGNDLSAFLGFGDMDEDARREAASFGTESNMTQCLLAMKNSIKPIVALVRGQCVGIAFTMTSHFDFIYCDEKARFFAPFMASA